MCIRDRCIANIGMFLFGNVWKDLKRGKWNKTVAKAMFAYGIPLVANSIAWWINNASDRYILTFFCGTALNGVYSVSYKIPSILSLSLIHIYCIQEKYSLEKAYDAICTRKMLDDEFYGFFTDWDNTPRYREKSIIFVGAKLELFKRIKTRCV